MPRPPRLPLQYLAAFRAAAREQNLRVAADALNVTPSAVSQQVRALEAQLGFAVFERRGRRLVLNPAGAELLQGVERAVAHLDEAVQAAAAARGGRSQRLRLTLVPSIAQRWLLPRLEHWRRAHPGIELELHTSQELLDLERAGFHAAIRQSTGPSWPRLASELLTSGPLFPVAAPDVAERLARRPVASWADEPLLGDETLWTRWFAAAGVERRARPVATFNDAGIMLQAVERGLGIALARRLLAADALADGALVRLSDVTIEHDRAYAYYLAYPPRLADWPPLGALREWLTGQMAALDADAAAPVGRRSAALSVHGGHRRRGERHASRLSSDQTTTRLVGAGRAAGRS